jgi:hypothetical protein
MLPHNYCERPQPSLCLMGLTRAELDALAEGGIQIKEETMDEKMMGVVRHVLTAIGACVVYAGWTDDQTWMTVMGSLMTMIPFMWSWVSK